MQRPPPACIIITSRTGNERERVIPGKGQTSDYLLNKMYGKAQSTWGEGMVRFPGENLWEVIHAIMDQSETEQPDYTAQIAALQESLGRQYGYAAALDAQLTADIAAITEMIQTTLQTLE